MLSTGPIQTNGIKRAGNLRLGKLNVKTTDYLLATVRQVPADVEIVSHQLMLRAGMIRQLASGIYNWLPTGLRVLRKVENIVREEMNRAGAQEVLMPSVQPGEIWKDSGRWDVFGPELLRFRDRQDRDFCLGPTHEEVITNLINNEVHSYRQLPANFYQIQWKFRDELRPRFGVMRCREFLMKDAYSFDIDRRDMEQSYQVMYEAYCRVFERLGLDYVAVAADSGAIGGNLSTEFHVLAESGEDGIGICSEVGFAANVELIDLPRSSATRPPSQAELTQVQTPAVRTIEELCHCLSVAPSHTLKTLLVRGKDGPIALLLRGDHELNQLKAAKMPGIENPLKLESAEVVRELTGTELGSIGPIGLDLPMVADYATCEMVDFVCGANQLERHYTGVNWGRDLPEPEFADLRKAVDGDPCPINPSLPLTVKRGIEVGHVFQLGTKYSEALDAHCIDSNGANAVMWMGCYGIGVSRIVAAAIEQNHDASGIIWPNAITPFMVCIVPINFHQSTEVAQVCLALHDALVDAGVEVLLDDREDRPGVKFADMDLLGIPHRLVVSDRGIAQQQIEYKRRHEQTIEHLPLKDLSEALLQRIRHVAS